MGTKRIARHQLLSHLQRERPVQTALDVDSSQFSQFAGAILAEFLTFTLEVRPF